MRRIGNTLKPIPANGQTSVDRPSDRSEKTLFKGTRKKIALVYDLLRRNEKQHKKEYDPIFGVEREIFTGVCDMLYTDYKEHFNTIEAAQERMQTVASISNHEYVNLEIYVKD